MADLLAKRHPPPPPPPGPQGGVAENLSVKFASPLSFQPQINFVVGSCFGLLHIPARKSVGQALITLRLGYANTLYLGLPVYLVNRLHVVQNTAETYVGGKMHTSVLFIFHA